MGERCYVRTQLDDADRAVVPSLAMCAYTIGFRAVKVVTATSTRERVVLVRTYSPPRTIRLAGRRRLARTRTTIRAGTRHSIDWSNRSGRVRSPLRERGIRVSVTGRHVFRSTEDPRGPELLVSYIDNTLEARADDYFVSFLVAQ